jgi:predicted RNA-binding Zn-ribbon protein involved in translation (DUF1610 family)
MKIKCPKCGNSSKWRAVQMQSNGDYKATCSKCGTVVEGKGGFEVETVKGDFTF